MRSSLAMKEMSNRYESKIRVMLVDDSVVVRGLLGRWLAAEDNFEVVSRCHNGVLAVREVSRIQPTLIVLDIDMPEMNGLEALPILLKAAPEARIIIASGLSHRDAQIGVLALQLGAHDYIAKPLSNSGLTTSSDFRTDLIARINALCTKDGGVTHSRAKTVSPNHVETRLAGLNPVVVESKQPGSDQQRSQSVTGSVNTLPLARKTQDERAPSGRLDTGKIKIVEFSDSQLRHFNPVRPEILCIGSSTGGPRALQNVLTQLAPSIAHMPVVLTQHMPKSFTSVFAEHLNKILPLTVKEACDGDMLQAGCVYVAPGDFHLTFQRTPKGTEICLDDGPELNFCKPAVDKMFASAAQVYTDKVLGIILTGMGHDGVDGGKHIVAAGGNVLAQDQESSIVWGMPGAAFKAGICCGVYSLDHLPTKVAKLIKEGAL